jgi:hypothetical protein
MMREEEERREEIGKTQDQLRWMELTEEWVGVEGRQHVDMLERESGAQQLGFLKRSGLRRIDRMSCDSRCTGQV